MCIVIQSGLTPLHVAAFMGHMNVVLFLLQHGANPNSTTVRGETSLHLAARANQTDILRILLRNGAVVDAKARVRRGSSNYCCAITYTHYENKNAGVVEEFWTCVSALML